MTMIIAIWTLLLPLALAADTLFNTSICSTFALEGVYYKLNYDPSSTTTFDSWSTLTDSDIQTQTYIFNYCQQVQYYCQSKSIVVSGSLIVKSTCEQYTQSRVQLTESGNITSGIKIIYQEKNLVRDQSSKKSIIIFADNVTSTNDTVDNSTQQNITDNNQTDIIVDNATETNVSDITNTTNTTNNNDTTDNQQEAQQQTSSENIMRVYICNYYESQSWMPGCPEVQESIIFHYFNENQLGFTITIEIIGILFMVLGVYIYRVTIVLIAGLSVFLALLAIEAGIIFQPGVPSSFITVVIIINGVTSLFTGYVFGYFPKAGLFFLGGWIGFIISLTLNNIAFYYIISEPANLTLWIVLPILSVIFGLLSLFIRKTFIIVATSLIGAYVCLRALSWHLGAFPNQFLISRQYQYGLIGPVPWQFYLYVIALVILTASSSALQYWLFQKKIERSNQAIDIDEHFISMEKKIKNKRENLVDFQNIFKKEGEKQPKRLKRSVERDEYDSGSDPEDSEQQQESVSEQRDRKKKSKQQSDSYCEQDDLPDAPDQQSNFKKLKTSLLPKRK